MGNNVNALTWNVPISNPNGTPTPEFMRKWSQQAVQNGTIPASAAQVSALLDLLGATPGDVLVRGSAGWVADAIHGDGTIDDTGALVLNKASATAFGIVKVDGTTITATAGVISAVGGLSSAAVLARSYIGF